MTEKSDTALSTSDVWSTPAELYGASNALYGPFALDAAADERTHKTHRWLGPGTKWPDALRFELRDAKRQWSLPPRVWLNPPYSRGNLDAFMAWARRLVLERGFELVTCLVPGHTAEGWWHRHVERPEGKLLGVSAADSLIGRRVQQRFGELVVEQLRIRGRVRFVEASGATGSARFPSVLVTYATPAALPRLAVRRGPPLKITPQVEASVRELVAGGASMTSALDASGVARKTWYRYLERKRA